MPIYEANVVEALTKGQLAEIEAAFEKLVMGEGLLSPKGSYVPEQDRSRLIADLAAVLAHVERPLPRALAAVLHEFDPSALNALPTFSTAAAIVIANLDRFPMGDRHFVDEIQAAAAILAAQGLDSPELRRIGIEHSGMGRGDAPDGAPGAGAHIPGGGEGQNQHTGEGAATDPDAG